MKYLYLAAAFGVAFAPNGAFANFDGMENSEHQSDIEEGLHTTALPSNQHTLRGRARSLAQLCSGSSLIPCGATGSRATICSGGLTERCISNNSGFAQYMQISNSVCGRCSSPVCQFECCDDSDCKDPNNPTCSPSENICFNAQRLIPLSALLTWNGTVDLDLYFQTPGALIYWQNKNDIQTGGFLDNDERGTGTPPFRELIRFPNSAPEGTSLVYVQNTAGSAASVLWTLKIDLGEFEIEFSDSTPGGSFSTRYSINYNAA